MMTQENKQPSLMLPLMAGMAGAFVALLFAPRSGKETRERLKVTADDLNRQAHTKYSGARHAVEEKAKEAKELKGRLHDAFTATRQEAKDEAARLKAEAEESRRRLRSSMADNWEEEV